MESLAPEVEPFGVRTTIVGPGFFRTELLQPESTTYAELSIDDYAERRTQTVAAWQGMNGQQAGDPAKLAQALVAIAAQDEPPLRWVAGAVAVAAAEQKAKDLLAQVDAHRKLSTSLAHDDAQATACASTPSPTESTTGCGTGSLRSPRRRPERRSGRRPRRGRRRARCRG